jgi:Dolichyl-phosphate-mannose-protein mannosyltransferase
MRLGSVLFVAIPLALAAFTHLWNPTGFPLIHTDEGFYMGRAMHVLSGLGPQEFVHTIASFYDHPYFGQLFLAGVLYLVGYPGSVLDSIHYDSSGSRVDISSIEMLYAIPRLLMGVLSVIDTFLVYKIAERRYDNKKIAFIGSTLFAVMPITWITRLILLDTILLPFLLASILLSLHIVTTTNSFINNNINRNKKKNISILLLSGILLGCAIFTKIPIFTMIPLVGFYIYRNSNGNLKYLGLWLIPVILIPSIWPIYAISIGDFKKWVNDVLSQTNRVSKPLIYSLKSLYHTDPVWGILALAGGIFAVIRRDIFALLWSIPLLVFLYWIGFVSNFHLVAILPVGCILTSYLIVELSNRIKNIKIKDILPFVTVSAIGMFGLIISTMLVTTSVNASTFETLAFTINFLSNKDINTNDAGNDNKQVTMIANPLYLWIPSYIFHEHNDIYVSYWNLMPVTTKKVFLIVDNAFQGLLKQKDIQGEKIREIYKNSNNNQAIIPTQIYSYNVKIYPYRVLTDNYDLYPPKEIAIRTNFNR